MTGPKLRAINPTDVSTALSPVAPLTNPERSIFNLTVSRHPHLKLGDAVLLTAYARAAARVLRAGKGVSDADLERRVRIMAQLARSLRLTPQSCIEPKTVGRMRRDAKPNPVDEFFASEDGDA
jgi:hypothetical protein